MTLEQDVLRAALAGADAARTATAPVNGHAGTNGTAAKGEKGTALEPWLTPTPLEEAEDQPDPFPLEVLPADVARFFRLAAEALNCPVDYPACFGLGIVAGVTGALYVADVKPGYSEPLSLYVCVVAPKGCGKTPALKTVADPVYFEAERRRREGEEFPAYVSDVTVEKLADLLRENNRGLPLIRDELAAWFGAMDQYKAKGTGSDRQFWLSAYSCDPVSVHRKDPERPPIFIRYPCVSVIGGIQPPVLARLKGDDDGCFDRILFSFPEPLPAKREDWRQVPERDELAWNELLRNVMKSKMQGTEGGHTRPWFLKLSADARRAWEGWTGYVADTWNDPDFPEWLKGPLVKLRGYAVRLAGVVHVLREECIPEARNEIEGADMEAGARLARYFLCHARKVYRTMGRDPRIKDAQKVLAWLEHRRGGLVSRRDLWRGLRKSFDRPEDLLPPLKLLQAHGFIRWVDPRASNMPPHATDLYSVWPPEAPTLG